MVACDGCSREVKLSEPHLRLYEMGGSLMSRISTVNLAKEQLLYFHSKDCLRQWLGRD
jgi:hypothetical protein